MPTTTPTTTTTYLFLDRDARGKNAARQSVGKISNLFTSQKLFSSLHFALAPAATGEMSENDSQEKEEEAEAGGVKMKKEGEGFVKGGTTKGILNASIVV